MRSRIELVIPQLRKTSGLIFESDKTTLQFDKIDLALIETVRLG